MSKIYTQSGIKKNEREELLPYFEMVQDKVNWKNPINKIIEANKEIVIKVSRAVVFFTGTETQWTPVGNKWRVQADGYYLGPCN